jgi:hypothetical protein
MKKTFFKTAGGIIPGISAILIVLWLGLAAAIIYPCVSNLTDTEVLKGFICLMVFFAVILIALFQTLFSRYFLEQKIRRIFRENSLRRKKTCEENACPAGQESLSGRYPCNRAINNLSIGCGILLALFTFKENVFLQFAVLGAFCGLLVSFVMTFIHAIRHWREHRWRVLQPFLLIIFCGYGAPEVGRSVRNIYFRQQIPRLEKAIDSYQSTGILPDVQWRGYMTRAGEWNDLTVAAFWWGSGFPLKHTMLLYFSGDNVTGFLKDNGWHSAHPLKNHWWVVRD